MNYAIDNIDSYGHFFEGKRLALICNQTSLSDSMVFTKKLLKDKYDLKFLLAPEHGIKGFRGAGIGFDNETDEETGLKVLSLYKEGDFEFPQFLFNEIDAIVYDIQDVGMRCYTYISTLYKALHYCSEHKLALIVLDRPNILGNTVDGFILDPRYKSFVGIYNLSMRYSLTVAEFINMVKEEEGLCVDLKLIPMTGYNPSSFFDDLNKKWIAPSPAIVNFENALSYSAFCYLEATNLSEGRGTESPFMIMGAPFIDPVRLSDKLNERDRGAFYFNPVSFVPAQSKYKGEECFGVRLGIKDKTLIRGTRDFLIFLKTVYELYNDKLEFITLKNASFGVKMEYLLGQRFEGIKSIDACMKNDFQLLRENEIEFENRIKPFRLY